MRLRTRTCMVIAVAVMLVAACSGDDDDEVSTTPTTATPAVTGSTAPSTPAEEPCTADKAGGSVKYGVLTGSPTLDPYDSGAGPYFGPLYGYLMRYNPDGATYEPELAESMTPNADASVWTMTLPANAEFGNGDPYDAAAVKASMDHILAPDSTSRLGVNRNYIKAIDVVDPRTVRFTLDAPWGGFPGLLSGTGQSVSGLGAIRNMKIVNAMGQKAFSSAPPVGAGAGPFEVTRFAAPEAVEYKAKTDWWGGPVCIQTITMAVMGGAQQMLDAFNQGELDIAFGGGDPGLVENVKDSVEDTNYIEAWQNSGFLLLMNAGVVGSTPPTTDLRVRRAIAAAVDTKVIADRAFGGSASTGNGLINAESSSLKRTTGPQYDPALAKRLVDEVKAEKGWDGSIRLIAANNPRVRVEAAIAIASMMEAVGFKVDLNAELSTAQLGQIYSVDKNYDVVAFGIVQDDPNLWIGLRQWASPNADNLTGFKHPDMDAALTKLRAARGVDEINAAMVDVQKVWTEQVPGVPYAAAPSMLFWQDHIENFTGYPPNFDSMWSSKK